MSNRRGIEIAGRILEAAAGDSYAPGDSCQSDHGNINDNVDFYVTRAKLNNEVFLSSGQLQEYFALDASSISIRMTVTSL